MSCLSEEQFTSIERMVDAFYAREIDGIIIDGFTVGVKKKLFETSARITQTLAYDGTYGRRVVRKRN